MMASGWATEASSSALAFSDDGMAVQRLGVDGDRAAALLAVPRDGGSFELAVVVERLPKSGYPFYFGVAREMPSDGAQFGLHEGSCGLRQHGWIEGSRVVLSKGFGVRTDRNDAELGPQITEGTRLALQLSPVGVDHCRTLRFFADGSECAALRWIQDDGKSTHWVAGCNPSECAVVRIVPAEGSEIWTEDAGRKHADAYGELLHLENMRQLSLGLDGDLAAQLQRAESATTKYDHAVAQAQAAVEQKHKAAEALSDSPAECETELRKELQRDYDVDAWPTCGKSWKQCRDDCELSGEECEQCRQGGNLLQMHAACRAYSAALAAQHETGAGYPVEQIDDLVAARIFTRRLPFHVADAVNAAARERKEPNQLPDSHRSMFVHLRRACFGLQGARQDERLYRQQRELDSKPREYVAGSIVHWRAFTVVTRGVSGKPQTGSHGRGGVLCVLEPPHAYDNFGANLTSAPNGRDTLAVPAALSAELEQNSSALTADEYAFDATNCGDRVSTTGPSCADSAGAETDSTVAASVDKVLLPAGCAFRVLSVEVDEDRGLRVVRLQHLGAWVSEDVYALPEISMGQVRTLLCAYTRLWRRTLTPTAGVRTGQALQDLRDATQEQQEHGAKVLALRRKFVAMQDYEQRAVGRW